MGRNFNKKALLKQFSFRLMTGLKYCFLLSGLIFPQLSLSQTLVEANELVVSIPAQAPPYYHINERQKPDGFAIEIFEAVMARAGLRYRYDIKQNWSEIEQDLRSGDSDIVPNLIVSDHDSEYLNFTSAVTTYPISIFALQDNMDIQSTQSLAGKKIAVINDGIGHSLLKERQDLQLKEFDQVQVAFYELISGQVDALVYPEPEFWHIANGFDLDQKIRALTPAVLEIKRAIAVVKTNPELLDKLEISLQAFLQSEHYDQIYQKWFVGQKQQPFWDVSKVFWVMTSFIILLVVVFLVFRHRELLVLNTSLENQIEQATEQLSQSNEYLKDLTVTDSLTGISNRRAFEHSLNELMNRSNRYGDSFSMLLFDIDDFKKLNDVYGHDMGDRVLKDLVDRVSEIVRDVDVLSRWGGEEFTILMPRTNQAGAMKMAERCRRVVDEELFDEVGPVTVSLGATCFQSDDNERKLFKRADDALYQAKSEGKNRVVWKGERCV